MGRRRVKLNEEDDDDDSDDSLLNGFSRPKRSNRVGFDRVRQALALSARKLERDDAIRRIQRERLDVTDEDRESSLIKVEHMAQLLASNSQKPRMAPTSWESWMVAEDDKDGIADLKQLIVTATHKRTHGSVTMGTKEIFNRSVEDSPSMNTDSEDINDPIAGLETCLQSLEKQHKNNRSSSVYNEIVQPMRRAMKSFQLSAFLESANFETCIPPPELLLWLCQVAPRYEPVKGYELDDFCEQAFLLITRLLKKKGNLFQTARPLDLSNMIPQLEQYVHGGSLELKLSKFLQFWLLALRSNAISISADADRGQVVRSCIVALVRIGLDKIFHQKRKLLTHLQNLMCELIDLAFPEYDECAQHWCEETAKAIMCRINIAPVDNEDENVTECLSLALAVELIPLNNQSSNQIHQLTAHLQVCLATKALEMILDITDWESHVQGVLKSADETVELADKATKSHVWLAFASTYIAIKVLLDGSVGLERNGPSVVSILGIILACWKSTLALLLLSRDKDESQDMIGWIPMFEPHFLVLSKVAQRSQQDAHFQTAEFSLSSLMRLCQAIRGRTATVTPSPVKIQTTMFDFLPQPPGTSMN